MTGRCRVGVCLVCKRQFAIRGDGTLRRHRAWKKRMSSDPWPPECNGALSLPFVETLQAIARGEEMAERKCCREHYETHAACPCTDCAAERLARGEEA